MQKFLIVSLFGLTALIGFSTRVVAKWPSARLATLWRMELQSVEVLTIQRAKGQSRQHLRSVVRNPTSRKQRRDARSCGRSPGSVTRQHLTGTPGAGWGLGPNVAAATRQAMTHCRATAGKDRAQFCRIQENISL